MLSGLADPANGEHFKVPILQKYGPAAKGIQYVNFMVDNTAESCTGMSKFWLDPGLAFIPDKNRLFGVWGSNRPTLILGQGACSAGCTDKLFPWMKKHGVGIAIWQWWTGDFSKVDAVASAVRMT